MNKKAKKGLIITAMIFGSIIALFLLLYATLWIVRAAKYSECIDERKYVCDIPALNSGFVPQGIGYSAEEDTYIMTGYNGDVTQLFLVKNNRAAEIKLNGTDGNRLHGHGGGVTCATDYVYIANEGALTVYSLQSLIAAKGTGKPVAPLYVKNVDNNASFVFSDSERLFVGEFYREQNYKTDKSHHYKNNKAIVSCYPLDQTGAIKPEAVFPDYSISVTGLVQGFAVKDGTYILSRSYGLSDSKLEYYTAPYDTKQTVSLAIKNEAELKTAEVPLYCLDNSNKFKTLTLPSFSEDLVIVNGRVAVTNEAACNKYIIGKLFGATKVYSFPVYKK